MCISMQICAGDGSALVLRASFQNCILFLTHLLIQQYVLPTTLCLPVDSWRFTLLIPVCLSSDLEAHTSLITTYCSLVILTMNFRRLEITCIRLSKCYYGDRNQLVQKIQTVIMLKLFMLLTCSANRKCVLFLWIA